MFSSTLSLTSALDGLGGQRHAPAALPPRNVLVPIVQAAGWAPGPVWTGAENITPTGIRSSDRPARSKSLYRLSYLGHPFIFAIIEVVKLVTLLLLCSL